MKRREIRIFALFVSAIFLILFFQLFNNALAEEIVNNPPVLGVDFSYEAEVGQEIVFDSNQSFDPDGDDLFILWDFADGIQSQDIKVTHIYDDIGQYNVLLSVTDGYNFSSVGILINIVEAKQTSEIVDYSSEIIINELLPNPEGSDNQEWVELFNKSSQVVNLNGWLLRDASDKTYIIDSDDFVDTYIEGRGFFVIPRSVSSIALNNSGETVDLLNPNDVLVDSVIYNDKALDDVSFARNNIDDWQWTETLTKGEKNIFQTKNTEPEILFSVDLETEKIDQKEISQDITDNTIQSTYATSGKVVITELLPSPDGDDRDYEFIEIYNADDFIIDITDWLIGDQRTFYTLKGIIEPDEYIVLERKITKIVLNNTGDIVILKDSLGRQIDSVEYTKATKAKSYSFQDDEWYWVDAITPGESNNIENKDEINEDSEVAVLGFSENIIPSVSEIYDLSKGEEVILQGRVTVTPGEIDERLIYIQDETGGVQIYMHNAVWPDIEHGDIVEISGIVSQAYGEYRVKIKSEDDIKYITTSSPIEALGDVCKNYLFEIGTLVKVEGSVVGIKKPYVELDVGCDLDNLFVRSENSILSEIKVGDILNTVGIIRVRSDKVFLHSLELEIIQKEEPAIVEEYQSRYITISSEEEGKSWTWVIVYTGIVIAISLVSIILYIKKIRLQRKFVSRQVNQ